MATADIHVSEATHDDHEDHHEHEQSFVTKYIFSQDHKVIAKQFLISGILWAVIGGMLSLVFRIQLGFPNADLYWLRPILGDWITTTGSLDPEFME